MKDIDPALVVYSLGGIFIVFATFVVLALLTEGVKTINGKIQEEDKKKKEAHKKRAA
jgi:hypothetical protein